MKSLVEMFAYLTSFSWFYVLGRPNHFRWKTHEFQGKTLKQWKHFPKRLSAGLFFQVFQACIPNSYWKYVLESSGLIRGKNRLFKATLTLRQLSVCILWMLLQTFYFCWTLEYTAKLRNWYIQCNTSEDKPLIVAGYLHSGIPAQWKVYCLCSVWYR